MKRVNPKIIRDEIRHIGRFLVVGGFGARVFNQSVDTWVAIALIVTGVFAIYMGSREEGGDDNV